VYRWIGILDEVIALITNLMEPWKTRLEIWSNGENLQADGSIFCVGFYKGIATPQLAFALLRFQSVNFYNKVDDT